MYVLALWRRSEGERNKEDYRRIRSGVVRWWSSLRYS